jgi:hypothetical protein
MFGTDVVLILLPWSVLVEQVICAIFFPLFNQSDLFSANLCRKWQLCARTTQSYLIYHIWRSSGHTLFSIFLYFKSAQKYDCYVQKTSQLSHIFKSRQTQNTWQSTSKRKWRHTDFVGHLDYTNILLQSVQEH